MKLLKIFPCNTHRLVAHAGFNLIEVILTLTLVAIGLPVICHVFYIASQEEAYASTQAQAGFLAASLMDEISRRRFWESAVLPGNGPDSGEQSAYDRRNFDDIDDYDVFQSSWGILSPPRDETGAQLSTYSQFTQAVDVYNVKPPNLGPLARDDLSEEADGSTTFKMVKVTIGWDSGKKDVKLYKIFAIH